MMDRGENRQTLRMQIYYSEQSKLELSGLVGSTGQYTTMRLAVPVDGYRERKKKEEEESTKKMMFVNGILADLEMKGRREERTGEERRE